MNEIMRRFVKGLIMERNSVVGSISMAVMLAGKHTQEEQTPVAYLYNGVRLPKLPEWDRETYPYAVIVYSNLDVAYFLYTFDERPIVHYVYSEYYDTTYLYIGKPDGCTTQFWGSNRSGWDKKTKPDNVDYGSVGISIVGSERVHWSNTDILNEDGTVYLAASEPIPVYE